MSETIGNIGSWIGSTLGKTGSFLGTTAGKGLMGAGVGGAGLIQNWLAARQANQKQKFVQDLITNPQKFNALVAQTEQPLSKGLTSSVERQANAQLAESGMGSSPAVMADVYAQALAPYQQQEQQMAIQSLLSRLGTYASTPTMQPVNVGPIMQALMMKNPATTSQTPPVPNPSVGSGSTIGNLLSSGSTGMDFTSSPDFSQWGQ